MSGDKLTVSSVHNRIMRIWNTMAVIPGHIRNETVIIGNHRDAWVMGAVDPTSGTVTMHEVVRGFGTLLKKGWKPLRSIVFASWDAEEYGMIGSTEWTEDFPEWISVGSSPSVSGVNVVEGTETAGLTGRHFGGRA
ncbi:hypothetical protein NUW54_g8439 [Trametes sanguinea]|uniref:Uncharacterized protein n=1 Tax=Trametes sanguinea TaxID=158606 RepID=A0ACC1PF12_9APHY|nr:hypothetical protein NUW54_g8439 [Trametes sanguinea]